MAKLLEKNGAEMCSALVSMARPIRNFMDDPEFMQTFKECTKKGVGSKLEGVLTVYADMMPLLFGDKHMKDTLAIIAIVEGVSVNKMLKMNGTEMIEDCLKAWKEQIKPFFMRLGLSA